MSLTRRQPTRALCDGVPDNGRHSCSGECYHRSVSIGGLRPPPATYSGRPKKQLHQDPMIVDIEDDSFVFGVGRDHGVPQTGFWLP